MANNSCSCSIQNINKFCDDMMGDLQSISDQCNTDVNSPACCTFNTCCIVNMINNNINQIDKQAIISNLYNQLITVKFFNNNTLNLSEYITSTNITDKITIQNFLNTYYENKLTPVFSELFTNLYKQISKKMIPLHKSSQIALSNSYTKIGTTFVNGVYNTITNNINTYIFSSNTTLTSTQTLNKNITSSVPIQTQTQVVPTAMVMSTSIPTPASKTTSSTSMSSSSSSQTAPLTNTAKTYLSNIMNKPNFMSINNNSVDMYLVNNTSIDLANTSDVNNPNMKFKLSNRVGSYQCPSSDDNPSVTIQSSKKTCTNSSCSQFTQKTEYLKKQGSGIVSVNINGIKSPGNEFCFYPAINDTQCTKGMRISNIDNTQYVTYTGNSLAYNPSDDLPNQCFNFTS